MKNKENSEELGQIQFVPVQKWYEVLQDLEMRVIEHFETGNIDSAINGYLLMYWKTECLIRKHIEDPSVLEINDIDKLKSKLLSDSTDANIQFNNGIYNQIRLLWGKKMKLLYALWVKSGISLPLIKSKDISQAILELD